MEIFPEDKIDPTVAGKEFHVEQTLGVMAHVRVIAKKRKWQYLNESEMPEGSSTAVSFIRKFYSQPETAAVTHKDGVWAVWSDEGEPTTEAFPEYTPVDEGPGAEFLKGLQARMGIEKRANEFVKAQDAAAVPPKEGSIIDGSRPMDGGARGGSVGAETRARNEAYKRAESDAAYAAASRADQEAWAYSTNVPTGIEALNGMRARYKTREDAPIELHPNKDIAAIWLGKGEPARPAFPFVQSVPMNGHNTGHVPPTFPAPVGGSPLDEFHAAPMPPVPVDDLPRPVKVSGHVPSAALNEMGVKLYGMSKEPLYSEKLRQYLANVSDSLHAEAARIELGKMREKLDARDRPPPQPVPLARLTSPAGEK